ncbi:MAG: FtsQ-type POTRA domain-containing protein [Clostridia bacterium]|nr:FtsQ-type POTRA domain-containing protein [Clostridia bacterium]
MADRRGNSVERYYAGKQKKRKRRKTKLYFGLILFCIITLIVLSLTVFFNIRSFRVQGNNIYTAEQIVSAVGLEEGDNMFRINKFHLQDQLTESLPYIGTVRIYRKLPTTLCIDVQETKARLVACKGTDFVLMDQNFKVLEVRDAVPKDVTYLIGCGIKEYQVGHTAVFEKETTAALVEQMLSALYERFDPLEISAIDITELHALRVYYDHHRVKLMLGANEKLGEKLQMAENAIAQNGINEKARIDITNPSAAYYRALDEEEVDDVEQMLLGKAKPKEEKPYQSQQTPEEEDQTTDGEEES